MKKLLLTWALCLFAGAAFAQMMFPQEGKILEYSMSVKSPMGNQDGVAKQSVKSRTADQVVVLTEAMNNVLEIPYKTADQNVSISLKELLASSMGQSGAQLEVVESSGDIMYPFDFVVGKEYEGATAKIKGKIQGMDLTIDMSMENRKAEAKESVTVPAGTFECIKVVEELVMKFMGQEQITETATWYAPGVGMIKQTTSAMNGMMNSVTELTKISDK